MRRAGQYCFLVGLLILGGSPEIWARSAWDINPLQDEDAVQVDVLVGGPLDIESSGGLHLFGGDSARSNRFKERLRSGIEEILGRHEISVARSAETHILVSVWGRSPDDGVNKSYIVLLTLSIVEDNGVSCDNTLEQNYLALIRNDRLEEELIRAATTMLDGHWLRPLRDASDTTEGQGSDSKEAQNTVSKAPDGEAQYDNSSPSSTRDEPEESPEEGCPPRINQKMLADLVFDIQKAAGSGSFKDLQSLLAARDLELLEDRGVPVERKMDVLKAASHPAGYRKTIEIGARKEFEENTCYEMRMPCRKRGFDRLPWTVDEQCQLREIEFWMCTTYEEGRLRATFDHPMNALLLLLQ